MDSNLAACRNLPGLTLSALDFSPVFPGRRPLDSIWQTLDLASKLEAWGYSRYWLGEHHTRGVAHSSPDLLVSIIGGLTDRIRVGCAGVLLNIHSPLRVAKNFRLLNAVYHNRVDLGIARGHVGREVETLLRDGATTEVDFESKVVELLGYLRGASPVSVNPDGVSPPEVWMLGRNSTSMQIAAANGTAFCWAEFIAKDDVKGFEILSAYRNQFRTRDFVAQPQCSIAVAGICAESDSKALELVPKTTPISVLRTIIGGPETWRKELFTRCAETGASEFVVLDMCESIEDKLTSYSLLADIVHQQS